MSGDEIGQNWARTEAVAISFVRMYYETLLRNPEQLGGWYGKDSYFSYGYIKHTGEAKPKLYGGETIQTHLGEFASLFQGHTAEVVQYNWQPTLGQSAAVAVWGKFRAPDGVTFVPFHHHAILSPSSFDSGNNNYFIRNDTISLMPEFTDPPPATEEATVEETEAKDDSPVGSPEPAEEHLSVEVDCHQEVHEEFVDQAADPVEDPVVEEPSHAEEEENVDEEVVEVSKPEDDAADQKAEVTEEAAPQQEAEEPFAVEEPAPKQAAKPSSWAGLARANKSKTQSTASPTILVKGGKRGDEEVSPAEAPTTGKSAPKIAAPNAKPSRMPAKSAAAPVKSSVVLKVSEAVTDDQVYEALPPKYAKCVVTLRNKSDQYYVIFADFSEPGALEACREKKVVINGKPLVIEEPRPPGTSKPKTVPRPTTN